MKSERFLDGRIVEIKNENPCFIAESPALKDLVSILGKISTSVSPVLILGEKGAGKSAFAFQIFLFGGRSDGTFFEVDCADFPDLSDVDFSGFDGGTVFFREVSNLSTDGQNKVLDLIHSVLERKREVKVLASSSENLGDLVLQGSFLNELFVRLNVLPVRIPPLRERREDVVPLARLFMDTGVHGRKIHALSEASENSLESYSWPGNVWELRNVVERACLLETQGVIRSENLLLRKDSVHGDFFTDFSDSHTREEMSVKSLKNALDSFKRAYIIKILEENGWNQTEASRVLDIQRTYLSRLMGELKVRDEIKEV